MEDRKMKEEFVFYFDNKVRHTQNREEAIKIFRDGGFYKAVCNFNWYNTVGFRLINKEEDI